MAERREDDTKNDGQRHEPTETKPLAMTAPDDADALHLHYHMTSVDDKHRALTTVSPSLPRPGALGLESLPATANKSTTPPFFPLPLSVPPAVQTAVTRHQYLELMAHPRFEDVTRAIFIVRQIGESQNRQRLIADQHKRSMDGIHRARTELQNAQQHSGATLNTTPDIDSALNAYLKLLQGLSQELILTQSEANNACTMFEQQIKVITSNASQMEGPVALSATDEDHLRQVLKRKYTGQIRHLNEEFRRKRKKGKLPVNATDVLRSWWDNNLAWPYPSEDEKRDLAGQTDLNPTQINNWFINQRKRHWHKFFKDGRLPQSPEEAIEILKQQGIIP